MSDTFSSYEKAKLEREHQQELAATRFEEEQTEAQNDEEEYNNQQEQEEADAEEESDMLADEEKQLVARDEFQRVREMAKEQVKAEIKKEVKKRAKKMIAKRVVVPIFQAVAAFFVATWEFWLALGIMCIFILIVNAYACEFVNWAPAILNPLAQYFGFNCST